MTLGRMITLVMLIMLGAAMPAQAQLTVDITRGTVDPVPIAIPDFAPVSDVETPAGKLSDIGASIGQVITSNLVSTGLFRAIDEKAFIEKITAAPTRPRFAAWRPLAVQALVTGRIELLPNGNLRVEFRQLASHRPCNL
jgi:TolB protein